MVLLALAAPLLALRVGTPDDGALPQHRTERRAYDLVAEGFGPGANGPLVVAVDISRDPGVVDPIAAAIRADEGVARVDAVDVGPRDRGRDLVVIPTTGPQDDRTTETLERLRADVLPSALGDSPARAHIGGQTAVFADVGGRVADRLPYFIGAVILLSFLLLVVVFRSILVPLKAALLNLLSIGAAFGVLVMVFQWGWGADLIGLESTIPVLPFIPLFMFAILFGLSMDYEVFLLSRIREEYLATHDNEASVIHGIASTARVITSAALIMVSVFMGFVLGSDPTAKMLGLGLAVAVLVDATLVRLVLLPATMKLLGHANWWLPAWLDRLLPVVDVLGEARHPTGPGHSETLSVRETRSGRASEPTRMSATWARPTRMAATSSSSRPTRARLAPPRDERFASWTVKHRRRRRSSRPGASAPDPHVPPVEKSSHPRRSPHRGSDGVDVAARGPDASSVDEAAAVRRRQRRTAGPSVRHGQRRWGAGSRRRGGRRAAWCRGRSAGHRRRGVATIVMTSEDGICRTVRSPSGLRK